MLQVRSVASLAAGCEAGASVLPEMQQTRDGHDVTS
jgi:hypothetical protein